ncbi:MAG: hypothetical protein AAF234_13740 [Pseudomonadota bacterium]
MPKLPDYVVNKGAEKVQAVFIIAALLFGVASWGMFENGDNGFMPGLIAFVLFVIGCIIKTKKKYVGGTGVYK